MLKVCIAGIFSVQCSAGPFHPEREVARARCSRMRDVHHRVDGDRHPCATGARDHVGQGDMEIGDTAM
jgi:hypothetical protein